jgi:hypothetical protein
MKTGSSRNPFWLERDKRQNRKKQQVNGRREDVLKDWYGPELAREEIVAHQRPCKAAGDYVEWVVEDIGKYVPADLDRIREAWRELVGDAIAAKATPVAVKYEVLHVEVAHSTWLYVLASEHKANILKRVQEISDTVKDVKFVPAGRAYRRRSKRGEEDKN